MQALGRQASVAVVLRLPGCSSWALECWLSSCGAGAYLFRGMWDLPGPGTESVSPELASGFLPTGHQGSPVSAFFRQAVTCTNISLGCLSVPFFLLSCLLPVFISFFFYPGLFLKPGIFKHFYQNAPNNQKGQKKKKKI